MPVIPELLSLRQEDDTLEPSLGYLERTCLKIFFILLKICISEINKYKQFAMAFIFLF